MFKLRDVSGETHTHVWAGYEESKKGKDPGKSKSMIVGGGEERIMIMIIGTGE